MTRKRTREPLARLLSEDCGGCGGTGRTRSLVAVGNEILRKVERENAARPGRPIRVRAAGEVASWLNDSEDRLLTRLQQRLGVGVEIDSRPGFS
ncbi:MAG TPA: hypothetical protein DIT40_06280, partial [Alphaproteobacteria bacterium]|nr:hypothetical protein [Alphaproteobacteria bacterium]